MSKQLTISQKVLLDSVVTCTNKYGFFPRPGADGPSLGGLVRRKLIFKSYRGGYKPNAAGKELHKELRL